MSPTVFIHEKFRFFFFSREEPRMHVHVRSPDGEAKFWMEPHIELALRRGLRDKDINWIEQQVRLHENQIRSHWERHFRDQRG